MKRFRRRLCGILVMASLLAVLAFFYIVAIRSHSLLTLLAAYLLAVSADALLLILHLVRRHPQPIPERFNPAKLTILIISYNGGAIIGETIRQARRHVPSSQIIVVSDNSRDSTADIARSLGVRVYENERNYGKSMSINRHIRHVHTPYTLILDDDTHIGHTFIPTSLLDAGYSAVAFNVMPIAKPTLANHFQRFEYSKSMVIRKGLRSDSGSVGNVSGAIGLYHTRTLVAQSGRHSGQTGGEDQQRTLLTHLEHQGRGVVYCSSAVRTLAPSSLAAVFRQRAFKWNTSTHENFLLNLRAVLHPETHYMLKLERAYSLFILMSEPYRMLFYFAILFAPLGSFLTHILIISAFYITLELAAWLKTGREAPLWTVLLFPLYAKFCAAARFIAHFYWFKKKWVYSVRNHFHRLVTRRHLLSEYFAVSSLLAVLWTAALFKLVSLLRSPQGIGVRFSLPQLPFFQNLPPQLTAAALILTVFTAVLTVKNMRTIAAIWSRLFRTGSRQLRTVFVGAHPVTTAADNINLKAGKTNTPSIPMNDA